MPRAGPPASRRWSPSARACGAVSAALLKGSGAVWPCGTIMGASTCPMLSSRNLPSDGDGGLDDTAVPQLLHAFDHGCRGQVDLAADRLVGEAALGIES